MRIKRILKIICFFKNHDVKYYKKPYGWEQAYCSRCHKNLPQLDRINEYYLARKKMMEND